MRRRPPHVVLARRDPGGPAGRASRVRVGGVVAVLVASLLPACSARHEAAVTGRVPVVTTTPLLADMVRNVGGEHVDVTSLVPVGADPHSYDPSLRDVRSVVYAKAAFSNYLMLEEQSVIKTIDANLVPPARHTALAESAPKYGAQVIPLVENAQLDTPWLGLRVRGTGARYGATRASSVRIVVTNVQGPGHAAAYITETFGRPGVFFATRNGVSPDRPDHSTFELPTDAHTHMSWGFTAPGTYTLGLRAELVIGGSRPPVDLGSTTLRFAVGVDPSTVTGGSGRRGTVVSEGHADVAADLDTGRMVFAHDPPGGAPTRVLDPAEVVVEVPTKALGDVPADPAFAFLDRPGRPVYLLPQAVIGKHVHGEIDPHLWHDVRNVKAYAKVIRDELSRIDPAHASTYARNTAAYLDRLSSVDAYVRSRIASIPPERRHLVTTHDAFGYLARAYGLHVAGFVTPNPATEPSISERVRLVRTLTDLKVPAVFLEPQLARRSSVLTQVAKDRGIRVCPVLGDNLTDEVTTYEALMRFNADSLHHCLS